MLESSFKYSSYIYFAMMVLFIGLLVNCIIEFESAFTGAGGGILVCSWVVAVSFLLYSIIRKELFAITITRNMDDIKSNVITIKKFYGLGKEIRVQIGQLDGFYTSKQPSRGKEMYLIYLVKDAKKIAKISSAHYKNYNEISVFIKDNMTYLGDIGFSYISDIKYLIK